jgi:serine-type D-Ala-D-Ala carboxypeptidase/endopeptidase (penicillin-binding protein 4)
MDANLLLRQSQGLGYGASSRPIFSLCYQLVIFGLICLWWPLPLAAKPQRAKPAPARAQTTQLPQISTLSKTTTATPTDASWQNLQTQITNRIQQFIATNGASLGVAIAHASNPDWTLSYNAQALLMPASNTKLYTTIAALHLLGPNFRWRTSVYGTARVASNGQLNGDLILYGRGDPTLESIYIEDKTTLAQLAQQLAQSGMREVTGDLILDESYFTGGTLGTGWEWLDLQWHYGAEVSALTVHDNALELKIQPSSLNNPVTVSINPPFSSVNINNNLFTAAANSKSSLAIERPLNSNTVNLLGQLPISDAPFTARLAVHQPAQWAGELFRQALQQAGIVVRGQLQIIRTERLSPVFLNPQLPELTMVESPPLKEVVRVVNKFSQNLYAELLLRTLGKTAIQPLGPFTTTDQAGVKVVLAFLAQIGIANQQIVLTDGSGLSRQNLVTAESMVRLLRYIYQHPQADILLESLPIAGVDGTLRRRFLQQPAQTKLRAKTGTLAHISSLAGYVTTTDSETFMFSIIVNNFAAELQPILELQEDIGNMLAGVRRPVPNVPNSLPATRRRRAH